MAKTLFVGSIAWGTDDEGLRAAFEQAAPGQIISAKVIRERETGRSKGFGFVDVSSDEAAAACISFWNGKDLDGRKIVVNEARPKPEGGFNR